MSITVTALDASNAPVTNYTATMHFASTDAAANLPPDGVVANGTGTFSVTLRTPGSQTVAATDTANSGLTGVSAGILVSRVATHLGVTAPAGAITGTPVSITVTALDASNAPVTNYTATIHFTSTDAAAKPATR